MGEKNSFRNNFEGEGGETTVLLLSQLPTPRLFLAHMQHAAEEGKGGSSPPDNKYKITEAKVSSDLSLLSDSYVIPTTAAPRLVSARNRSTFNSPLRANGNLFGLELSGLRC
jgi:hypothetical protein